MSAAISGSSLSTAVMGGICMTDLLACRLHTAGGAQGGRPPVANTAAHARHGGTHQGPFGTFVTSTTRRRKFGSRPMPTSIILDCDPGIDDALAIAFAHGHPGIDLLGITTVAGNVGLAQTTANAL